MNAEQLARLLSRAAAGDSTDFAWLDGGPQAQGWVGVDADRLFESDDLSGLDALDRCWKAEPDKTWIGWIDYDLGADAFLGRRPGAAPSARPGFCARRYPHAQRVAAGLAVEANADLERLRGGIWPLAPLRARVAAHAYRQRVAQAIAYIQAGDTYQVNLSQAFDASVNDSIVVAGEALALGRLATSLYLRLRAQTPASMGALIQANDRNWLISNSPETLFEISCDHGSSIEDEVTIISRPIKGTRPRFDDVERDRQAARELLASEKDLAEHIMIVDLVRNDLGRLATPGSVRVSGAPALTSLPTVHHLVSEVSARLAPGWSLADVVASLFPGGSITGAPKRRTCQIIDKLEGERRGVYCGAIFVLSPEGAHFSIPIRTGELSAAGFTIRSGGGVVVDSDPEAERLETLHKARAFDPVGD